MNNFKILIVEDDPGSLLTLESAVHKLGYSKIFTADNSETGLSLIAKESPDLLLLDIQIKGELSGIEMAQKVKHLHIPVIFITGLEDAEIYQQAKTIGPHAYLLKPFNGLTLETAIENVFRSASVKSEGETIASDKDIILKESFFIKNGTMLQKVSFSEINWIESDGNYCTLHTDKKKHAIRISLSRINQRLPPDTFVRIHKSYLVQIALISRIDTFHGEVYLGDKCLPLGRTYKDALLEQLNRI